MNNANTELSGRTPAIISWIQLIGLILIIASRVFFPAIPWLLYAGFLLALAGYIIRMYYDWKQGNKKAFRRRLVFLIIAFVVGLLAGYLAGRSS